MRRDARQFLRLRQRPTSRTIVGPAQMQQIPHEGGRGFVQSEEEAEQ